MWVGGVHAAANLIDLCAFILGFQSVLRVTSVALLRFLTEVTGAS